MIQETHEPDETDEATFSVWILPEIENEPTKYSGVVDVLKLPSGIIKVAQHDGVTQERAGEIVRLREECI